MGVSNPLCVSKVTHFWNMKLFLLILGLIGPGLAALGGFDGCPIYHYIDIVPQKTIPLEGYPPLTMNNFCRNLAGTFGDEYGQLTWTVSPDANPIPTLTGGVLETEYELNKIWVFSGNDTGTGSYHSIDNNFGDGELLMIFH